MRVRELLLWHAFHEFAGLYIGGSDDRFEELFFEDLEGAHRVLDRLIVPYLKQWPDEAKRELGFSLGASLVFRRAQLIGSVTPTNWNDFPDPADALYGYVFWRLFPGRSLTDLANAEISWDVGPIENFLEHQGPLPVHDWAEFY